MLLAGVLLPLAVAPLWLKRIADANPFYWGTAAMRSLFAGHPGQAVVWEGALVVGALMTAAIAWATWKFSRALR
jgi:ABC-2 type transport system permease protein